MTTETAVAALEKAAEYAGEIVVAFFGGEPMLAWKRIRDILQAASHREWFPRTRYSMTSNLTYMPADFVEYATKYRIRVMTDIDGPPAIHEMQRPSVSGRPTHATIENNVRLLKDAGVDCTLRCTVTAANVDHLLEIARYFLHDLDQKSLNFPPVQLFNSTGGKIPASLLPDPEVFLRSLRNIVEELDIHPTRVHPLDAGSDNFISRRLVSQPCGMGDGGTIHVDSDGSMSPCGYLMNEEFSLGNILDQEALGSSWLSDLQRDLRPQSTTENFPGCSACELREFCGGGCSVPWIRLRDTYADEDQLLYSYSKAMTCGIAELSMELMSRIAVGDLRVTPVVRENPA
jgi:uncharacterized protein